jgi:guanine nucleotide-binding protein subunit beta-5
MEKQCSIYKVENRSWTEEKAARVSIPNKIVGQHAKYISHCTFFGSDQQLLTASGDSTCALWDLEMKDPVKTFQGHKLEVLG